jgi:tetratricopeptide (TPR) repeat protein
MKKHLILTFIAIIATSCGYANDKNEVACGLPNDPTRILKILEQNKKCPDCLLLQTEAILKSCPTDEVLQRIAMSSAVRARKPKDVLRFYELLAESNKASSLEHAQAGYIYKDLTDNEKAINSFKLALAEDDNPLVRFKYAFLLSEMGRKDEAVASLKTVVAKTRPTSTKPSSGNVEEAEVAVFDNASSLLAEIYIAEKKFDLAEPIYRDLILFYPDDPDYLKVTADLLSKSSDLKKQEESIALREKSAQILANETPDDRALREMFKTR